MYLNPNEEDTPEYVRKLHGSMRFTEDTIFSFYGDEEEDDWTSDSVGGWKCFKYFSRTHLVFLRRTKTRPSTTPTTETSPRSTSSLTPPPRQSTS